MVWENAMEEWPAIQHWLFCDDARVLPPAMPNNRYQLNGVSYRVAVSPATDRASSGAKRVKDICQFARFFGGGGPHEFEIEVVWHDDPEESEAPIETYGPYSIFFREGEPTRDYVFRLLNFPIEGPGRYSVRLIPLADLDRDALAVEYFEVVSQ